MNIKLGDLVMVVRACCNARVRPVIYEVALINFLNGHGPVPPGGLYRCIFCGKPIPNELFAFPIGSLESNPDKIGQPISWLKRLDPGTLQKEIPSEEEAKI